ncbi:acylglycerol kinase, mitochondrial [Vespa velutina]|uniref:acylglycerol kinase, mitochondrial n=1 Tax=Vespa velutina TaxID=202808 RepID=UPI001FB3D25D|nr:acylglycerol kinase, mitochondrial [Vespa velutina]XP_047359725.1 acylglycerol kinase, mitochondrial [Vespa velutina]XP_047359806.1 acylglycerol kinase, mitochondrial [Vespa velutina]
MARMLKFLQTIRNNWKKSTFGAVALSYGVSYSKESYDTQQLMRQYCEDIVKYGDEPCPTTMKPRHVTVILNPAAKNRKATKLFKDYCEPLLHLAGIAVTIVQTESTSHTRSVVENLDTPTDAIIVAGGDGTLSDVITGIMRRYKHNLHSVKQCPIGVLPLGETNTVSCALNPWRFDDLLEVREMTEATMTIIKGNHKFIDIIEVYSLKENPENELKPVYAAGTIEWGAWQDAYIQRNKYLLGKTLRKYATYIFNGYKDNLNWNCNGLLRYTKPCTGCSHCYKNSNIDQSTHTNKRWWHAFVPKKATFTSDMVIDYSKITNENCGVFYEIPISTTDLYIKTSTIDNAELHNHSSLKIQLGPKDIDYISFVNEGWRRINGSRTLINSSFEAKDIELYPEKNDERVFYIDNEEFELTAIRMKLLPQCIKIFCSDKKNINTLNR